MGIITSLQNYLLGSWAEIQKITWPTKKQTINYSLLVISLSLGVAVFFSVLDYFSSEGINFLINNR